MVFKKYCNKCGELFQPTGKFSKFCESCKAQGKVKTKKFKTPKSEIETRMEEILSECENIISKNYLTTTDSQKIISSGYKLLAKCEELRKSRDRAIERRTEAQNKLKQMSERKPKLLNIRRM